MLSHELHQPKAEKGFEHVNRYFDNKHQVWSSKILPGEFYVTAHGEMIGTVLGSCISACVRDVKLGIGGMNPFYATDTDRAQYTAMGKRCQYIGYSLW